MAISGVSGSSGLQSVSRLEIDNNTYQVIKAQDVVVIL